MVHGFTSLKYPEMHRSQLDLSDTELSKILAETKRGL